MISVYKLELFDREKSIWSEELYSEMLSRTRFALLFFTLLLILEVSCKKKTTFFARYRPDFKYCMDNRLFPRFFKTFCPGKGERWLKARARVQKQLINPLMNQDTANSFVKKVGVTKSAPSDDIYVREDFYNAYREECCSKGCRLEETIEFCNTLT